jgi:hypothetical protein
MKIVPVVCFVLAAAAATSMLPVSSSYALTYPDKAQNCSSTGSSTEGVSNCLRDRNGILVGDHIHSASSDHSLSTGHGGRQSSTAVSATPKGTPGDELGALLVWSS